MALFNDPFIKSLQGKDKKYLTTEDKPERKGGRFAVQVSPNGETFFFVY
jgi:hypothetical protein